MPNGSWQCHVCGTVYAWWVSRCRAKHSVQPPSPSVLRHCGCADNPCTCMRSGGTMTTTIGGTT